jgi:predicted small lipoprotein YifL
MLFAGPKLGLVLLLAVLAAGCGQKGALYLPDAGGEVVTRPMEPAPAQTPPAVEPAAKPDGTPATTPSKQDSSQDSPKPPSR